MAMLENFKALSQLKEQLDGLQIGVKAANDDLAKLNAALAALREQTQQAVDARNTARQEHSEFVRSAKEELDGIQDLRIKLGREINALDQVKRELATTVAKRVEAELRSCIGDATAELKSKSMDIKGAKETLDSLSQLALKANESLNRLQFIATDIKSKDFDLSKALDVIKKAEQEKMELQQRVERAESYAAKEVRRMRDTRRI